MTSALKNPETTAPRSRREDNMTSITLRTATVLAICTVAVACGRANKAQRRIELGVPEDKVRGGWAGQMIGVSFGYPTDVLRVAVRGEPYRDPDNIAREGTDVALSYLKVFQ
jgi:hypothetical protein